MARILLIDQSKRFVRSLVPALEQRNDEVQVVTTTKEALGYLRRPDTKCDVVMMDLSANRPSDWEMLDSVRLRSSTDLAKPKVLCISDRNWGPEMRLDVERKGGRLALIRECA